MVPGPGQRTGFSDGESVLVPNTLVRDTRLDLTCYALYSLLLIEGPPFHLEYHDLVHRMVGHEKDSPDSAEVIERAMDSLRNHGYLIPCEGGWMLDVPDDGGTTPKS